MRSEAFYAPLEVKFAEGATAGIFEGYGAVFGNVDAYGDVIQKGAFRETLREWKGLKKMPPMLVQHGGWMMTDIDALPVGIWEAMSEDDTGLQVKGRLINLDTERGKTIYGAMKEGALDGMSIGYRAKEFALGTKPEEPRRTLKKIDLIEVSVVTFPANGKARVGSIKSLDDLSVEDIREIEAILRTEDLSQRDAAKAVAGFKKWLRRDGRAPGPGSRDEGAAADLADVIRRNIASLSAR